jgi:hypothetical protein
MRAQKVNDWKTMPSTVRKNLSLYCNKFAGSTSQWKFTTLTVQYTTLLEF